jgi:aminoglycoside 3-N-acetyltransferase
LIARVPLQVADIHDACQAAGIKLGDLLLLHADAMAAAQLPPGPVEQRLETLLSALEEFLGPLGTLILPTFTYSFCRNEEYDPIETPSTVGLLTEYFRQRPGVLRSSDPLFSVAAKGARAAEVASLDCAECFGPKSFFAWLHANKARLGFLACGLSVATMAHYAERRVGVPYRQDKVFTGRVVHADGSRKERQATYYVRDLEDGTVCDLRVLEKELRFSGALVTATMGRVPFMTVGADDFCSRAEELLAKHPRCLTRSGAAALLRESA